MSGWLTNGMENWDGDPLTLGDEAGVAMDTDYAQGASPQTARLTANQLGLSGWIALTQAATIATDASLGTKFYTTMTGNRTLGNPTNMQDGQTYSWRFTQDGTGSRTLAYGSKFLFPAGAPTLSTGAGAIDKLYAIYDATTDKLYANLLKAYAA